MIVLNGRSSFFSPLCPLPPSIALAVSLRSIMNDVMHAVYNRRMVTEEMFVLVYHILNVQKNGQISREHFLVRVFGTHSFSLCLVGF